MNTREISTICPALEHINPKARHSIMRDIGSDGKDYWTTKCAYCGEVPSCGNHDWDPSIDTINGINEYLLDCLICGHKWIVDKRLFEVAKQLFELKHDPESDLMDSAKNPHQAATTEPLEEGSDMEQSTPPQNFIPRDWHTKEYDDTEPHDRFEIHDGPQQGGIETNWQPDWGVLLDLPPIGQAGDGLGTTIEEARRLRDSLNVILDALSDSDSTEPSTFRAPPGYTPQIDHVDGSVYEFKAQSLLLENVTIQRTWDLNGSFQFFIDPDNPLDEAFYLDDLRELIPVLQKLVLEVEAFENDN